MFHSAPFTDWIAKSLPEISALNWDWPPIWAWNDYINLPSTAYNLASRAVVLAPLMSLLARGKLNHMHEWYRTKFENRILCRLSFMSSKVNFESINLHIQTDRKTNSKSILSHLTLIWGLVKQCRHSLSLDTMYPIITIISWIYYPSIHWGITQLRLDQTPLEDGHGSIWLQPADTQWPTIASLFQSQCWSGLPMGPKEDWLNKCCGAPQMSTN